MHQKCETYKSKVEKLQDDLQEIDNLLSYCGGYFHDGQKTGAMLLNKAQDAMTRIKKELQ